MFYIERVDDVIVLTCPVCREQERVAGEGHHLEELLGGVGIEAARGRRYHCTICDFRGPADCERSAG
ncbi:hypothetical protein [Halomonas maura]|uniref:hypothetical protein n=1 Tax=Halomonas maura TaxID=117606 RepID=UPI0025B5F02C|nr:hypothetical protein [Halomonas maura]MDN3555537.1 hypothetical protein [Halomonas maura]